MKKYNGISASPGVVEGPVLRLRHRAGPFGIGPFDLVREQQRLAEALLMAQKELQDIMNCLPAEEQAIVEFQCMLLEDDGLMNEVRTGIREGLCAAEAMDRAGRLYAQRLLSLQDNPYMQLRGIDILDVSGRVADILNGIPRGLPELEQPVILAAERMMPTDLFCVPSDRILGVVTAEGSEESHAAILARAMNIPGIVQVGYDFLNQCEGHMVRLDGTTGECILDPEDAVQQAVVPAFSTV